MEEAMAGAVVGATIQVVLQNLLSFSVEPIGHIWNTKNNFEMLKQSLVTIRGFLEEAETNRVTDKSVQRWLMKLEDVVFYADYVCDEFNYEVLRKKVQRGGGSSSKPKMKVMSFYKTVEFGLRIKKINDELESINDRANGLGLQMTLAGAPARGAGAAAPASSETDSMSRDRVFVGRENDATKIEKVINSPTEQKLLVLPIVGMGGLGKTTLARKVFNDAGCQHNNLSPFENRIWFMFLRVLFHRTTYFPKLKSAFAPSNSLQIQREDLRFVHRAQMAIASRKMMPLSPCPILRSTAATVPSRDRSNYAVCCFFICLFCVRSRSSFVRTGILEMIGYRRVFCRNSYR